MRDRLPPEVVEGRAMIDSPPGDLVAPRMKSTWPPTAPT
jgi:hypothetical protein